jgi:CubicO group peptidase (beta-lactamase class C family)
MKNASRCIFYILSSLLLVVFLMSPVLVGARVDLPKNLDTWITDAMKDWELPGLAIAIVKDDKVVFAKGFGVKKLGDPASVDENTVFAIGSCTKAFTAAALAILVEDGKIAWDDRATKYLRDFRLMDQFATSEMTVRDLLSHHSGLPSNGGDTLWYGTGNSREEILKRLRYLQPVSSFRSQFGYSNLMYMAAGQIIPSATGKTWDDFLKERIFAPAGMTSTNTSVRDLQGIPNLASPHIKIDGKVQAIPYRNLDNIGPAGSINSSVRDMARWIRLQLGRGDLEGRRIFTEASSGEMWSPQTIVKLPEGALKLLSSRHFEAYGLGWGMHDSMGRKVLMHSGGIDGMISDIELVPEERLGVVVLTNSEVFVAVGIADRIIDWYLGAPDRDWSAEILQQMKAGQAMREAEEKRRDATRAKGAKPSLAIDKYTGSYTDSLYGGLIVELQNGSLVARFGPGIVADLVHWQYDSFRLNVRDRVMLERTMANRFVTFIVNEDAKVDELQVTGLGTFKRLPAAGVVK